MTANCPQHFLSVMLRALIGRCPNCGNGRLFARYLKQVESCAACGERFGHIRADDGPAWLTMLVVGHVMAPVVLMVGPDDAWPNWRLIAGFPAFALILALVLLPRAKGLFIAAIWRTRCIGADK
jgi:uncharacterized protein (DUF983 family)